MSSLPFCMHPPQANPLEWNFLENWWGGFRRIHYLTMDKSGLLPFACIFIKTWCCCTAKLRWITKIGAQVKLLNLDSQVYPVVGKNTTDVHWQKVNPFLSFSWELGLHYSFYCLQTYMLNRPHTRKSPSTISDGLLVYSVRPSLLLWSFFYYFL